MAAKDKGRLPGDIHVAGNLSADSITYPDNSIGDGAVDPTEPLAWNKTVKVYRPQITKAGVVASFTEPLYVANGEGTLMGIEAGMIAVNTGGATVTIDVKKNGVTVLSTALVLDNTNTARVTEDASLDATQVDYAAGDFFEVVVTAAAGGGAIGSGLAITGRFNEVP